jgi:hypothetical protein
VGEKYSTEVPQQRLTTARIGDQAHTGQPAVRVAILVRLVSCKQKVRGSSPLAGSQLKAPFPALEGGFC